MIKKKTDNLYFFGTITVLTLIALLFAYVAVWDNYKNSIFNQQKEQMQIISSLVCKNFQETLEIQLEQLEFLATQYESSHFYDLMSTYLENYNEYLNNAMVFDENDVLVWSYLPNQPQSYFETYILSDGIYLKEVMTAEQEMKFAISKKMENGDMLQVEFVLAAYYDKLISQIKIGESGYIVLKNAQGIILMHPTEVQIGEHIIRGREAIYGHVRLKSLQELVDFQNSSTFGVYEYDSYWWLEEDVPSARKISAHHQLPLGDSFLVISAVVDYNEVYTPVAEGFGRMAFIFLMILTVALLFFCYIGLLLLENKKNTQEILYLKDLNNLLERNKKIEEHIAHQQRLQIMGTMTGGIAHEFNNMLTPIMGYAELLQLQLPEDSPELDFASEILSASFRAQDVVKQISSLGRRKMDGTFQFLPIKQILYHDVKMMQSICPSHIQFSHEIKARGGFLGNETQINQVLLNLFVNATHAIEENGKIILSAGVYSREQLEKKHKSSLSPVWEEYIAISITDNGMGMDEETLAQIFHPFFTTKKKDKGLGLGLSLVAQIVEAHKGEIFVNTAVGEGSTFTLCFPVAEENTITVSQNSDSVSILFLDNHDKLFRSFEKNLSKLGVKSYYTYSTKEAKELLSQGISVLVIEKELKTPKGPQRGLHFALAIQGEFPQVQKILLVDTIERDIIEAKEQGFLTTYTKKPLTVDKLLDLIRRNV